ncbi:MAG: pyruvate kinase [Clostridia bacterium]|nr:pyruvate kinase [Clostridia bacterium]MBQ9993990.1 pyruvate kinase [Clostridia bacterium]
MRKTKIIATLGPATDCEGVLQSIIEAGAEIVRFNMSHGDHAQHAARMAEVKRVREELGLPIATILDTRGPEIRTGLFAQPVILEDGQDFLLTTYERNGDETGCSISYAGLPGDVEVGQRILIDDGLVEMTVREFSDDEIVCTVVHGGKVSSNKGINCPGMHFSMPFLSEHDKADLLFGRSQGFDYIAASFVRSAGDIALMRAELERIGWNNVRIIAKIENDEGANHMEEIIAAADGVMVARGDMGVEIPFEEIPIIQKKIIKRTVLSGKQVITATQMLESMMNHSRPTRAEISDVANAIYDGTSVVMLSGETAAGKFPVEAVRTMVAIVERTENDIDYRGRYFKNPLGEFNNITTAISHATVMTAHDLGSSAIVTVTESGWTARMVSRFRPYCPIIACTPNRKVWRQMNMSWGVVPVMIEEKYSSDELLESAVKAALSSGIVQRGDSVVVTAGVPLGASGNTNMIRVVEVD